jgi:hypothetical protein
MPKSNKKLDGKLSYDEVNNAFYFDVSQLYWSSIYLVDRAKKGFEFNQIVNELDLSREERNLVRRELRDLERLGFIKLKGVVFLSTGEGNELLEVAATKTSLEGLTEKAKSDLRGVEKEIEKVDKHFNNKEDPSERLSYNQYMDTIFCPRCAKPYPKEEDFCPTCNENNPYLQFPLGNYIINNFFSYAVIGVALTLFFGLSSARGDIFKFIIEMPMVVFFILIVMVFFVLVRGIVEYIMFSFGRFLRSLIFKPK